ncbi:conserved hypothetical protein [Neospora caninum Liverpool]|uniref:Uncharacterized protein n=1 Tax=Neospora caninum (strain Liverpool) TaxID=572307 RepID=F0V7B3_NEOCL|nr:conserved hypothetical protein [Neospora caninum Liverpool]CBZ49604.1 conserved hypothetical protein [Neospora caninum Liverpool]CEL64184.1 TPA: hypothetical protein BN1204_000980 [Neospora caninum Liverpool]|eukprot:XP_003879639.1 conserved hypothetical protein [Neospora caninum Liverpool]
MAQSPPGRAPIVPSTMPVSDVFSSFFARRFSRNSSQAVSATTGKAGPLQLRRAGAPARNDHPENWRMFMGGHDPASPFAEGLINVHNHNVMWMIFVVGCVMWPLKCRI